MENGAVEIVSFPVKKMLIYHSYVNVYQGVENPQEVSSFPNIFFFFFGGGIKNQKPINQHRILRTATLNHHKVVIFPDITGDCPIENRDFPIKNGDLAFFPPW